MFSSSTSPARIAGTERLPRGPIALTPLRLAGPGTVLGGMLAAEPGAPIPAIFAVIAAARVIFRRLPAVAVLRPPWIAAQRAAG